MDGVCLASATSLHILWSVKSANTIVLVIAFIIAIVFVTFVIILISLCIVGRGGGGGGGVVCVLKCASSCQSACHLPLLCLQPCEKTGSFSSSCGMFLHL